MQGKLRLTHSGHPFMLPDRITPLVSWKRATISWNFSSPLSIKMFPSFLWWICSVRRTFFRPSQRKKKLGKNIRYFDEVPRRWGCLQKWNSLWWAYFTELQIWRLKPAVLSPGVSAGGWISYKYPENRRPSSPNIIPNPLPMFAVHQLFSL